jgi:hypothetical protein
MKHFEEIWVEAENKLKSETELSTVEQICKEISAKIALYSSFTNYTEDISFAKNQIFGEIMLLMTQITFKDNIDVYAALKAVMDKY